MRTYRDLASSEPETLHDMIGQEHARNQLVTAVRSAVADHKLVDNPILLLGPGGCGKSQSAKCLANMIGAPQFTTILASTLRTPAELAACFLEQKAGAVLFADEAAGLSGAVQLAILLAVDHRKVFLASHGRSPVSIEIEPFVLILGTTHAAALADSLKQRCRIVVNFRHYKPDELEEIARRRANALGWDVEPEVFREASLRGRGTPRIVLRLLNASMRTTRSEGATTVTGDHFRHACFLEGVDSLGCDRSEQEYLQLLLDHGPSRLNMLSAWMGLPVKTIEKVVESEWLIRSGLVEKDQQSRRFLTERGRDHAALLRAGLGYE